MDNSLMHYGTLRRSGRYPWGSGNNPAQSHADFLSQVKALEQQGFSQTEVATALGINTTQLRARKSIAKNELRAANAAMAYRLKEKGWSNTAIAERMGIGESQVRRLLDPSTKVKADGIKATADILKSQIKSKDDYLDIGSGTEISLGVSSTKLSTSVAALKEEGYSVYYLKVEQATNPGKNTTIKVLAAPGAPYPKLSDVKVKNVDGYSTDGGLSLTRFQKPKSVSSNELAIRYGNEGGSERDGLIELRRGVPELSMGGNTYVQARIAVDGTHYIKGMAVYSDDLPDGVNIRFNTNKANTGNKKDALKPLKKTASESSNPEEMFGSSIKRQYEYTGKDGKKHLTALNIINDEGDWITWSKKNSAQFLSKQPEALAKQQLKLAYDIKKEQYEEISSLTNPVIKRKLLSTFADECDSSAVHLHAAPFQRQATHVLLPIPSLKDNEIYAPNYRNGETVVLVRYPHGGKFEIPELKVNNKNAEAKSVIGNAKIAVGINAKVAGRLSGADFDGDFVAVIPNNRGQIRTQSALEGLKDFNPSAAYPAYEGMKTISPKHKQRQMGVVSNLITDMTVRGATDSEITRAVRHSMVVIDAEKHNLNYKQSYIDNGIAALKKKYQSREGSSGLGASTLISRSTADLRIPEISPRSAKDGGPIDKTTGKKVYVETGATYTNKAGKVIAKTTKTTPMAATDDAFTLSSGTTIESVYATHANKLKALANQSRKEAVNTKNIPQSSTAKKTYAKEVASLKSQLSVAKKNAPLERQAQLIASQVVKAKRQDNPDMDSNELKKIKSQALASARVKVHAKKTRIEISDLEWEAIQAGAISNHLLEEIVNNANLDQVKQLATPRVNMVMTPAKLTRAKNLLAAGYTQAEVADVLGIPASTINSAMS